MKKEILTELRDRFNCKDVDLDKHAGLYSDLYEALENTNLIDYKYLEHLNKEGGYYMLDNPQELSLKECGTALTFILRADRFCEGAFYMAIKDGSIYKTLCRACELAN